MLVVTVPVGPDVVVWNLHRRYGPLRLPLLLEGWEVVARVGWDEARLTADANWRQSYEPVFVLRKPDVSAAEVPDGALRDEHGIPLELDEHYTKDWESEPRGKPVGHGKDDPGGDLDHLVIDHDLEM